MSVLKGSRVVAQSVPLQLTGAAVRKGIVTTALTKHVAGGRYTLRVRLLETTASGAVQGAAVVTRSLSVHL